MVVHDSWQLTDLNVIAHVFHAYNLAFILIFVILDLWLL